MWHKDENRVPGWLTEIQSPFLRPKSKAGAMILPQFFFCLQDSLSCITPSSVSVVVWDGVLWLSPGLFFSPLRRWFGSGAQHFGTSEGLSEKQLLTFHVHSLYTLENLFSKSRPLMPLVASEGASQAGTGEGCWIRAGNSSSASTPVFPSFPIQLSTRSSDVFYPLEVHFLLSFPSSRIEWATYHTR